MGDGMEVIGCSFDVGVVVVDLEVALVSDL